jgi:hypothetical protein
MDLGRRTAETYRSDVSECRERYVLLVLNADR